MGVPNIYLEMMGIPDCPFSSYPDFYLLTRAVKQTHQLVSAKFIRFQIHDLRNTGSWNAKFVGKFPLLFPALPQFFFKRDKQGFAGKHGRGLVRRTAARPVPAPVPANSLDVSPRQKRHTVALGKRGRFRIEPARKLCELHTVDNDNNDIFPAGRGGPP